MHREFLRTLTTDERRYITSKNNSAALLRLTVLLSFITATSIAIISDFKFIPVCLVVQGLLLISLFHLLHECIHDTPFSFAPLNRIVGSICGFVLFLPCEWFRYFHRDHHRYTQNKDKDPELATAKPQSKLQWLLHVSGLPLYRSLAQVNLRLSFTKNIEAFVPANARPQLVRQTRISLVLYALLLIASVGSGSLILFWIWILPLIIGQPFLRLYLLAEHTLCDHSENMFENTRTVLTNPLIRWFTWNMPYHTEHHTYPAVPFHKLPSLHNKMQQFLVNKDLGYAEFNRRLYQTLK